MSSSLRVGIVTVLIAILTSLQAGHNVRVGADPLHPTFGQIILVDTEPPLPPEPVPPKPLPKPPKPVPPVPPVPPEPSPPLPVPPAPGPQPPPTAP